MDIYEEICSVQKTLVEIVKEALSGDLASINTCELGDVIDMVKDISEVKYYENVVHAMESSDASVYSRAGHIDEAQLEKSHQAQ